MTESGLREVEAPSRASLSARLCDSGDESEVTKIEMQRPGVAFAFRAHERLS